MNYFNDNAFFSLPFWRDKYHTGNKFSQSGFFGTAFAPTTPPTDATNPPPPADEPTYPKSKKKKK